MIAGLPSSLGDYFGAHLGDRASALVDGQLTADEEERAWRHVESCGACQVAVQRETWMKQRLSGLSGPATPDPTPRPGLVGALYDVDALSHDHPWLAEPGRTRRVALAAAGAGSVGAAVLGLLMVTGSPAGLGERPARQVPARIGNVVDLAPQPTGAPTSGARGSGSTGPGVPAPRTSSGQ